MQRLQYSVPNPPVPALCGGYIHRVLSVHAGVASALVNAALRTLVRRQLTARLSMRHHIAGCWAAAATTRALDRLRPADTAVRRSLPLDAAAGVVLVQMRLVPLPGGGFPPATPSATGRMRMGRPVTCCPSTVRFQGP